MTRSPSRPKDFSHQCPDWDYLRIDGNSPEFASCTCKWPTNMMGNAIFFRSQQQKEFDRVNELLVNAEKGKNNNDN